jgi:hypothetical protein
MTSTRRRLESARRRPSSCERASFPSAAISRSTNSAGSWSTMVPFFIARQLPSALEGEFSQSACLWSNVAWTVETLNETADAELAQLPSAMRARLARISELIESMGCQREGTTCAPLRRSSVSVRPSTDALPLSVVVPEHRDLAAYGSGETLNVSIILPPRLKNLNVAAVEFTSTSIAPWSAL